MTPSPVLAGVTRFSVPRLLNFWSYAKVELRPPRISEISEASKGLQDLKAAYRAGKWKEVTVKVSRLKTSSSEETLCGCDVPPHHLVWGTMTPPPRSVENGDVDPTSKTIKHMPANLQCQTT